MAIRIASVAFMNAVPLVAYLARGGGDGDVELDAGLPSSLPARLESGTADIALVPVVELFRGCADGFLGGSGIACDGAVASVKLFFRGSPGDIAAVNADRGSRTSAALVRILLAEEFGIRPPCREVVPRPGALPGPDEATLVIGDRCFLFEAAAAECGAGLESLDLGAWWKRLTGLPFVFAVWGISRSFRRTADPAAVAGLRDLMIRARDYGLANLSELAAAQAARGMVGPRGEATAAAIDYYYRDCLRFELGPPEMDGIARFHELCVAHGLVPPGAAPAVL